MEELRNHHSAIAPALRFYQAILECQSTLSNGSKKAFVPAVPLRQQIDLDEALRGLSAIIEVSAKAGSGLIRERARTLQEKQGDWEALINSGFQTAPEDHKGDVEEFLVRASLQPLAENLQLQSPNDPNYNLNRCPACGGLPQLAVLRPEGEGALRSLLCSFCLREWNFRRIVCPFCGQEDRDRLPRFSSQECTYVHVEACDACKSYMKAIDLSVDGHAVPLVDEAALAVLDVWAASKGYEKLVPNLIGF